MRIGMVLETPFPPDIRLEKEMRALKAGGHEVVLLCGHKDGQAMEERYEEVTIVRFADGAGARNFLKAFGILYYWLTTRKRNWEVAIERFVKERNIEALHIHDLPLVPTGISIARNARIPLVFDMHEVYPVMIRGRFPLHTSFRKQINSKIHAKLFSPSWWDRVERACVEQADRIIVVVEESRERLLRMGIKADKIFVVLNAEDVDDFLALGEQAVVVTAYQDDFLVGYVGGVDSPNRGLDNLVRAWPLLLPRIPNARLLIVGDGVLRPAIEELVRRLDLTMRVTFAGWVPFKDVAAYIRALDVAVIPHVIDEHTNHTIPHKLFQYIALGKLVVASDIVPIRRILQDTGAGIIVDAWSPQGFAEAIIRAQTLLESDGLDREKQITVLKRKYGFKAVSEPLLNLYSKLQNVQAELGDRTGSPWGT